MDPQPLPAIELQPSRFPFLPTLLVLLLSISTGFLGYQNWQLRKEITSLKPLPSLAPTPTIDPVINWKTYTNSDYGFSFKYPNNWILVDNLMADTTSTITKDEKAHQINVNNEIGETRMLINPELPLGYGSPFTKSADVIDKKRVDVYTYGSSPTKHYTNFGLSAFPNFSIDTHGNARELDQILSTFQFIESKQTSIAPKTLTYSLPSGWQTARNAEIPISVSYDPNIMAIPPQGQNNVLEVVKKTPTEYNPNSTTSYFYAQILPYDSGSRHAFIFSPAGGIDQGEKLPSYHENEYIIDGKKCLFLIGLDVSMSPPTWGMCPLSSTQGIHVTIKTINDSEIETVLKTVTF